MEGGWLVRGIVGQATTARASSSNASADQWKLVLGFGRCLVTVRACVPVCALRLVTRSQTDHGISELKWLSWQGEGDVIAQSGQPWWTGGVLHRQWPAW